MLFSGQEFLNVVEAYILDGLVQVDGAVGNILSIHHGEDALAHRCYWADVLRIAVLEQDTSADRDDHAGCLLRLQPAAKRLQFSGRIPNRFRLGDSFPIRTGNHRLVRFARIAAGGPAPITTMATLKIISCILVGMLSRSSAA